MTTMNKCFKLYANQLPIMDDLIIRKIYYSRSEIIRMAIKHYLLREWDYSSEYPPYRTRIEFQQLGWRGKTSNRDDFYVNMMKVKDSIGAKLPLQLLSEIDEFVKNDDRYISRSEVVRDCVDVFLHDYKWLHHFSIDENNKVAFVQDVA